jgi:hypothetical protein
MKPAMSPRTIHPMIDIYSLLVGGPEPQLPALAAVPMRKAPTNTPGPSYRCDFSGGEQEVRIFIHVSESREKDPEDRRWSSGPVKGGKVFAHAGWRAKSHNRVTGRAPLSFRSAYFLPCSSA